MKAIKGFFNFYMNLDRTDAKMIISISIFVISTITLILTFI